jgi:hypothetical protein
MKFLYVYFSFAPDALRARDSSYYRLKQQQYYEHVIIGAVAYPQPTPSPIPARRPRPAQG